LIREHEDVRKQKEHWQQLIEEQKQRIEMFHKQQHELDKRHEQILRLHQSITDERIQFQNEKARFGSPDKPHKISKDIHNLSFGESTRSTLTSSNKLRASRSNSLSYQPLYLIGGGSRKEGKMMDKRVSVENNAIAEIIGEYTESQYPDTVVSEPVTDLESLNSISDEETEKMDECDYKHKVHHLQVPVNEFL